MMAQASVPGAKQQPAVLYYDGHCGLCHGAVKFVLKNDRSGTAFRFAPLQGETFLQRVPPEQRAGLPDSVAVKMGNGSMLVRSKAFIHIIRRLGGGVEIMSEIVAFISRTLVEI